MRRTFKGFAALSPLTLSAMIAGLVQAKLLAVLVGVRGVGLFALGFALLTLASTLAAAGIPSALMKRVAEIREGESDSDIWRTALLGIGTVTVLGFLLGILLLLFPDQISALLLDDPSITASDAETIIVTVAVGALPVALVPTLGGFLRGMRSLRVYVITGLIGVLLPLSGVVIGAAVGNGATALAGFVAGQALTAAVLAYACVRLSASRGVRFRLRASRRALVAIERALLVLGSLALLIGLAAGIGQNVVRGLISDGLGIEAVGLFAAAWSVSNRLPALIYKTFTAYLLPEISAMRRDWPAITRLQNDALRISLLVATPALALAAAATAWLIPVLFSGEFLAAADLLRLMLVGELLSIVAWALSSALYPTGRGAAAAIVDWTFWVIFAGAVTGAVHLGELTAIGVGYVVAQAVVVCGLLGYERRHHGFRIMHGNLTLVGASLALVGGSAVMGPAGLPTTPTLITTMVLIVAWAAVSLSPRERSWLGSRFRSLSRVWV